MIVFKTFLKVLNQCKVPIIMYTVFLIVFSGFNMKTSENSMSFTPDKPDILIINQDEEKGITKNLIEYLKKHSNIVENQQTEEEVNDALFYREINYIIMIPKHYREDFLAGKNPAIEVKSTGDYNASLAEMMLERYIHVANTYLAYLENEEELLQRIDETLLSEIAVEMTSKLDTNHLEKATFYYNFASYSILAGCVYVICLILASFKEENVRKRTIISSMNEKKYNRQFLFSNLLFTLVLWVLYAVLSIILIGDVMFSLHGMIYLINALLFTICGTTIALLIGNLVSNKNAINGIVNVVALGSSFLCGAFVPAAWLPDIVLKIAHILPPYYYINTNERLKELEIVKLETLKPILTNMGIILLFIIGFITLTNFISKRKRKIG